MEKGFYIGLDSGSVSLNTVVLDTSGAVLLERYDRIKGEPVRACRRALEEVFALHPAENLRGVAMTGSGGRLLAQIIGGFLVNEVLAQARAVAHLHPEVRSVIEMGGEDSKLLLMTGEGGESRLEDFSMNTVCAAGTGSFLDQQAARVGVAIEGEFGELAGRSKRPPRIAGRCSVFAKSDMIHLQQIATPVHDIIAGLCFALARNFRSDICRGKTLERPIAFQGGVAANTGMARAFREVLELGEGELVIPKHFASMGAIGAVLLLRDNGGEIPAFLGLDALDRFLAGSLPPPSSLNPLGEYGGGLPQRTVEVDWEAAGEGVFLGIDIGSISTNVVAIDADGNLLSKCYLMTASRPIEAVRRGLRKVGGELPAGTKVLGVGTTGSGRYMIGDFVGADIVRNEITAQATAALHHDPGVDTIFEIGGQDSKYISLRDGAVVDFEMNKVCAAGTGSFLEEQAERLGIRIDGQFGELSLQAPTPSKLGERCTVFMDSDLVKQQQRGTDPGNLAAGLCYSIVHNYLNKVVGDKAVGERIFLQGGIAFNEGVVAAFRRVTGKPITVPPHHDVTGAIGAALLARSQAGGGTSRFRGFELVQREYRQDSFGCKSCSNRCEINRVRLEGEKPLFYGGRCEKYEVRRAGRDTDGLPQLFEERETLLLGGEAMEAPSGRPRIGVPRVLHFYEFYPFWRTFLEELGFEAVPSPPSTGQMIREGTEAVSAESCFPVKIAHGHLLSLVAEGVDSLLLPSFISFPGQDRFARNITCPYSQALPYMAVAALSDRLQGVRLLKPIVDFQSGRNTVYRSLLDLGRDLGASKTAAAAAFKAAERAQEEFYRRLRERGREVLAEIEKGGLRGMVLVGRSYNTCDSGVNLGLPRKIRDLGWVALPMDLLPADDDGGGEGPRHMYWRTGRRILAAARLLKGRSDLLPVYLTNFGCGPDSFISHSFREEMAGSPFLQLEIDEHSADAGALTRLEAFIDSLPPPGVARAARKAGAAPSRGRPLSLRERTVYFPRMSDHAPVLAAAFRAFGQSAEILPEPNEASIALGRKFTSGKECYPCIVTTGDLVRKAMEEGFDPSRSAFFMPTGDGPCRFGQYQAHHARVLCQLGFEGVPLLSPAAQDGYGGMGQDFERLAWEGVLAVDSLDKLRRRFRPYAEAPEEAEEIYRGALERIGIAVEARDDLLPLLRDAAEALSSLPARREERPLIGVVGEIFLRSNEFSNEDLVRKLERYGGEVVLAPIAEWIFYTNFTARRRSLVQRRYRDFLRAWLRNRYQLHREKKYVSTVGHYLGNGHEPPVEKLMEFSLPYLHHSFEGEAVLTIGKAIDMALNGVSGVVSAMPFTCMPGTISAAIVKKVREDHRSLPFLNMVYDGQGGVGAEVRLEAFIHQARSYSRSREGLATGRS